MLINEIKELLKTAGKYFSKEEELLKNIVLEDTIKMDKDLIKLLMSNENSKTHFFIEIEGVFVFDKDKFIKFIENKEFLPNSYTAYKNKIGLTDSKGAFIKEKNDVVLSWAYKDCYLEGGQDKEDMKKNEVFYNEILAPDEIDRLLEPKVLTNFKKYDADGEHKVKDITMEDNLIIKGNNLLALHSLKEKYAGKIKLIYIDPPYNTGSDSFKYNDRFNHSTWLTFMKNRLEIARELLRDDGVIFVQCDDNEQAYLKVLMDEVFKGNFVNCIIPEMSNLSGNKIEHAIQGRKFPKIKEYILLYAKNKNNLTLNIPKQTKNEWDAEYNIIFSNLTEKDFERIENLIVENNQDALNEILKNQKIKSLNDYLKENNIKNTEEWKKQNSFRILASKPNTALRKKALELNFKMQITSIRNSRGDLKIIRTDFNKETDTARIELVFAKNNLEIFLGDIWHGITTTGGVAQEGGVILKNGKKPEQLLEVILKSATQPDDIVLDYHLGSGTTCAVAHKMKRKYIGIEQMNYGENDSIVRLKNVINGDRTGISLNEEINWQGGGSFVYCELMKWNENFIEKINNSKNKEELLKVYSQIKEKAFLNYKFDIEKFEDENMKDFKELKLEEQKDIIKKSLDLNSLYVNLSEIEDETYNISEEDKKLNKIFYNK